jgi:hypothetical protein
MNRFRRAEDYLLAWPLLMPTDKMEFAEGGPVLVDEAECIRRDVSGQPW